MTVELAIILVTVAGYGAGFMSAIFYRWIKEAKATERHYTAFLAGRMDIHEARRIKAMKNGD